MIIIMKFGENYVLCPKYINIYEFWRVQRGRTYSTVHFLFIIKKTEKVQEHGPILKSNSTFWLIFFFRNMNNKKFMKGATGPLFFTKLVFLYKVSKAVLIDFIAMLITPGILLIQICI